MSHDELPDPKLFWAWVGKATRPVVGWVLVGVGGLMIVLGYLGVANEVLVAKQLPYLVSGGILGVAVVAVGVMFLGTEEIRQDSGRLDRLERMVNELHAVLLTRPDVPPAPQPQPAAQSSLATEDLVFASGAAANGGSAGHLVAIPSGDRYHLDTCRVMQGKAEAAPVTLRTIRRRGLEPCPLCEPVV
jgi:hypothetical protein